LSDFSRLGCLFAMTNSLAGGAGSVCGGYKCVEILLKITPPSYRQYAV
jgi:hypothetical protein